MAIKVTLRRKPIKNDRQSLYLDFYPPVKNPSTGKLTRREFLGLTLINEIEHEVKDYTDGNGKPQQRIIPVLNRNGELKSIKLSPIQKKENADTLAIAEGIRSKRHNELNKPEIYSEHEKLKLKTIQRGKESFITFSKKLANTRNKSNRENSLIAIRYLEAFNNGEDVKFSDLTVNFCDQFKGYLETTKALRRRKGGLSRNSASSYFNTFKATLRQAFKEGFIDSDLSRMVNPIKFPETKRNFLTIEELNRLTKTECTLPVLKRAALFSALTGLRYSDIGKLMWKNVEYVRGQGYFISFKAQKTNTVEVLPISQQAYKILGKPRSKELKVFEGLYYSAWVNIQLALWISKAKIKKKITFHCFRHTFATLQLKYGTDIYTISKMLGHKKLSTTEIYTKVADETKRLAVNKIKLKDIK